MMKGLILKKIFEKFEYEKIKFVVLRNHEEIPERLSLDNDLDLLIEHKNISSIKKILLRNNFKHKRKLLDTDTYLYKSKPHIHFYDYKNKIHLDIVNNLSYRSPNNNEWISVHEKIQKSLWKNLIKTNELWLYKPSNKDLLLHIICHCIFDKKNINYKYQAKIKYLFRNCDTVEIKDLLGLVFFKFTDKLISMINNNNMEVIVKEYFAFSDY